MNFIHAVKLLCQILFIPELTSVFADAMPKGSKTCQRDYPDSDWQNHVEIKCGERNLTFYTVAQYHSCCGCAAGLFVADDCGCNNQYTTVCKPCPDNSFTAEANVQRECTMSMPPTYCDKLQFTQYVKGNKTSDARCECIPGTHAFDPMMNGCKKHSTGCAKNFVVANSGNSTHDIQCKPCEIGHCTSGYEWALECRLPPCTDKTNSTENAAEISEKVNPPDPTAKTSTSSRTTTAQPKGTPVAETSTLSVWTGLAIGLVIAFSIVLVVCCCLCHKGYRVRKLPLLNESSSTEQDSRRSGDDVEMDYPVGTATPRANINSTSRTTSGDTHSDTSGQGTSITGSGTIGGSTNFFTAVESSAQSNQDSQTTYQESSGERDRLLGGESDDQPQFQNEGLQGAAHISEGPQMEDSADPYDTGEQPLKGRIRTEDPETYHNFFREQGFAVRYEPTVGPYSLLAAIVMWLHSNLTEDQVTDHVTALLNRLTQYIRSHPAIFRLAILQNSRSVDEYLEEIKRGMLVCGKIMAEAIALSEGLTVRILSTDGWVFDSTEGPMDEAVLIGHVQDNYYLLLCDLGRSRNADPEASSSTIPVSDSRLEARGQAMGQSYSDNQAASRRSAKDFRNGCGSVQGECATGGRVALSDLPPLPQHCECLEEGDRRKVRELIYMRPELESVPSILMQDTELAIQMLEGSNSLPDKATGLAEKSLLDVKAFFKQSGMFQDWKVKLKDLEPRWSPQDPDGLKDELISLVINEQGSRLTVERLIVSVPRKPSLYRLFCDNFIACLEMKCEKVAR